MILALFEKNKAAPEEFDSLEKIRQRWFESYEQLEGDNL